MSKEIKAKVSRYCRGCVHHHSKGVKDGIRNDWCCKFGKHAKKAIGHCKNVGGKSTTIPSLEVAI